MFKKIMFLVLSVFTVTNNNCSFFDSLDKRLEKKEYTINTTTSFVLQSQENIIRILGQKTIDKEQVLDINTLNKHFNYLIVRPLERKLKDLKSYLIIKKKQNTKNISKSAKNIERELTIKKHIEIYSILNNKLSKILTNQILIVKLSYEHPSGIFKDMTQSSYVGMNFLSFISFSLIEFYSISTLLDLLYFTVPTCCFFCFFMEVIAISLFTITWTILFYHVALIEYTINYYTLISKYEYHLSTDYTLSEYSYNYNTQETNKSNLFDDMLAMLMKMFKSIFN